MILSCGCIIIKHWKYFPIILETFPYWKCAFSAWTSKMCTFYDVEILLCVSVFIVQKFLRMRTREYAQGCSLKHSYKSKSKAKSNQTNKTPKGLLMRELRGEIFQNNKKNFLDLHNEFSDWKFSTTWIQNDSQQGIVSWSFKHHSKKIPKPVGRIMSHV